MKSSSPTHEFEPAKRSEPDLNRRRRRIAIAWLAVALWATLIWHLGGDDFSAKKTSSVLVKWFHALFEDLQPRTRYQILISIRKSAHLIEYAILAMLTFRAAVVSAGRNRLTSAAWLALFLVATLATADEARQAFSHARTGSPYDVLLDLLGGAVAIGGLLLVSHRMKASDDTPRKSEAT